MPFSNCLPIKINRPFPGKDNEYSWISSVFECAYTIFVIQSTTNLMLSIRKIIIIICILVLLNPFAPLSPFLAFVECGKCLILFYLVSKRSTIVYLFLLFNLICPFVGSLLFDSDKDEMIMQPIMTNSFVS